MSKGKTTASGIEYPIRCRACSLFYEKGAKPQKGQDDSLYTCPNCADAENERAAAEAKKAKR